jgi:hypothetical protein
MNCTSVPIPSVLRSVAVAGRSKNTTRPPETREVAEATTTAASFQLISADEDLKIGFSSAALQAHSQLLLSWLLNPAVALIFAFPLITYVITGRVVVQWKRSIRKPLRRRRISPVTLGSTTSISI